jgi:hypothetical protein
MASRWIDDIQTILWSDRAWKEADGLPWEEVYQRLEEVDILLRRAMLHVDNEAIYEKILEETQNVPNG